MYKAFSATRYKLKEIRASRNCRHITKSFAILLWFKIHTLRVPLFHAFRSGPYRTNYNSNYQLLVGIPQIFSQQCRTQLRQLAPGTISRVDLSQCSTGRELLPSGHGDHFANFIDCLRSRNEINEDLNAHRRGTYFQHTDSLGEYLSQMATIHLWARKTRAQQANQEAMLLMREAERAYREPNVIPEKV